MTKPTTMIEWLEAEVSERKRQIAELSSPSLLNYQINRKNAFDEALTKAKELEAATCDWTFRETILGTHWESGCGSHDVVFVKGVQCFKFCPFCGRVLTKSEVK